MLAVKEAKGNDEVLAWQFLNNVIMTLGSDGISSEDSKGEGAEPIFCTHILPCRRDIVKELNIIDQQRLRNSDIFPPEVQRLQNASEVTTSPNQSGKLSRAYPVHSMIRIGWLRTKE